MVDYIADYNEPRAAFNALLGEPCDRRILLLRGESGTGKSTLIAWCQSLLPPSNPPIVIQLRNSYVGVVEIFDRIARTVGPMNLPEFDRRLSALNGVPVVQIQQNWLVGINNRISVFLQADSQAEREQRIGALTNALFADAAVFRNPILIMFDTYEQAPSEVRDWISGPLLWRVSNCAQVRVVIAGQETPDDRNIEWRQCAAAVHLQGVQQASHWVPVVRAMGCRIPATDPESFLNGLCLAFRGKPQQIMQILEGLPKEAAPA